MKRVGFLIALLAVGCTDSSGGDTAQTAGAPAPAAVEAVPLRVAISGNYLPLHGVKKGRLIGLEVELAQALGKELGREVKFVNPKAFAMSSLAALEAGKVDISLNAVTITPDRKKRVSFTDPYVVLRYRLAAPPGVEVSSLEEVKGKVAVPTGPTVAAAKAALPNAEIIETPSAPAAVGEVLRGTADFACNEDVGLLLTMRRTALELVGPPFGESALGIAAPLGEAAPYNDALGNVKPQLADFIARWKPGSPPEEEAQAVIQVKESFNKVVSPDDESLYYDDGVTVKGETSADCSKIVVEFSNTEAGTSRLDKVKKYKVGKTSWKYRLTTARDNFAVGHNHYTFTATCSGEPKESHLLVYYVQDEAGEMDVAEMAKPVVYLYPTETTEVRVKPEPERGLLLVEPDLDADGSWRVTARPDGTIIDPRDDKKWPYLFWEGASELTTPDEGAVVARGDLDRFFSDRLSHLGLRSHEIADFEEYWLGKLDRAEHYFITFIPQYELDLHAPLTIDPAPDTVIRVFFDYREVPADYEHREQRLAPGPARSGFTVVEWGGRLYRN